MADKLARVRYYCDADVLGLAKVLAGVRSDVTYPGGTVYRRIRPPCGITPRTPDAVWIPRVATEGLLIITRDRAIQDNRAEIDAVRNNGARMVALSGREAKDTFTQLEILMCQWRRVEALEGEAGPFIYTATRTTFVPVDLGTSG